MKHSEFILTLKQAFEGAANLSIAEGQKAYMKNKFDFLGIKTPIRRALQQPFFEKNFLPQKTEALKDIKLLWNFKEREYLYFALEWFIKYKKQFDKSDIELMEYMVVNHSWWDTVDTISVHLIGNYFRKFPENRLEILHKWLNSGNIWLQRASILYQLKYKQDVDTDWMSHAILKLNGTKEFFINKAIGWVLREYSRTNPDWVLSFVEQNKLHNLSKREALRLMSPS